MEGQPARGIPTPPASGALAKYPEVRRVLVVTLALNLAIAVAKIGYGLVTHALSLLADGFHSLLDGSSNVIGLLAIHAAAKGPDAQHPYGHRKFEILASMAIAAFLALTCTEILQAVWGRARGAGSTPIPSWGALAAAATTFVVNAGVTAYESREGRRLGSHLLLADAAHTRSDLFVTISVVAALVAIRWGILWLDLVTSLAIVAVIGKSAYDIARPSFGVLSDATPLPLDRLEAIARATPGVRTCHVIRARGLADDIFVDMHIHVEPTMAVREAHDIAHTIEDAIRAAFPGVTDVVIHVEPSDDPRPY